MSAPNYRVIAETTISVAAGDLVISALALLNSGRRAIEIRTSYSRKSPVYVSVDAADEISAIIASIEPADYKTTANSILERRWVLPPGEECRVAVVAFAGDLCIAIVGGGVLVLFAASVAGEAANAIRKMRRAAMDDQLEEADHWRTLSQVFGVAAA